ncbi:uncharacterized protein LOC107044089 [Diachasma alloeum]|uniref:uncharacterized protein LOC107044089 n=1 Tax=Diachasma alloeum TaxID=454923 RepID=UPI0007384563|nr:uncharacterized protein LOC107044089 [Diachasma alloeum]
MIDARLNFKQQAEYVGMKASGLRASLSRLMLNVGGPKQRIRALLSSVVTLVLTYGIAIWDDPLQTQESRRMVAPVYRLSALRVAKAYRTVSEDAVCVIAGMLPIEVLAEERRSLRVRPENLVEVMLSSKAAWDETSNFVADIMKELRKEERERKNAE